MAAVGEAAIGGERDDVGEDVVDALAGIGKLEFAHAGRVDQPAARRQAMEFASGGGVAAVGVVLADAGDFDVAAGQRVDQRRLADAG